MSGSSGATEAVAGRRRDVATSAQSQRMRALLCRSRSGARGWLGKRGRLAVAGWLRLLRQDQLAGPRDAEPVLLAAVPDHQFSSAPEKIGAPHGGASDSLRPPPLRHA